MSVSKTPSPPGTWLTRPTICAARNAPSSSPNGTARGGSSTSRTAAARPQSRIDEHELPRREAGGGHRHLEAAESQWRLAHEGQGGVAEAEPQQGEADGADERGRGQIAQPGVGSEPERRAAEHEQAQPEGGRLEEHDPRQRGGAHAPARVEAEAHGGAGEHAEAEAVADRVADEPGQRHAAAVEAQAGVGDGELVVAGEDEVVEGGEQQGEQHPARGQARDRRGQLRVVEVPSSRCSTASAAKKRAAPATGASRLRAPRSSGTRSTRSPPSGGAGARPDCC